MMSVQSSHNEEVSMQAFNQAELTLRIGEEEVKTLSDNNPYTDFDSANDHYYVFPVHPDTITWVND